MHSLIQVSSHAFWLAIQLLQNEWLDTCRNKQEQSCKAVGSALHTAHHMVKKYNLCSTQHLVEALMTGPRPATGILGSHLPPAPPMASFLPVCVLFLYLQAWLRT